MWFYTGSFNFLYPIKLYFDKIYKIQIGITEYYTSIALCEFYGYKLTLEDSMNERGDLVTTSKKSKADHVIYTLMKDGIEDKHSVIAVIIEVKHCQKLNKHFTAQVMG